MPTASRKYIPFIIAIPLFMQNLDTAILSTALPQISRSLDVDPLHLNLAITSYLLSLAVFIPLSGWAADRFGARKVFRAAIVAFTIGSVFCGMANGFWELVIARVVQGMGGAMMVPVARLILLRVFPKAELMTAMVWFTMPATLGPISGPIVGGAIVTYMSWRWIFFINVPVGLIALLLVSSFIEDTQPGESSPFDAVSFILMAATLVGLMFGLETIGRDLMPPPLTIFFIAAGIAALVLYLVHWARFSKFPIIDLRMFEFPVFRISTITGLLFRTTMGGSTFLLPLMLQLGFGLSALSAGLITFGSATGALCMRLGMKKVLRIFGFRNLMIVNGVLGSLLFISFGWFTPTTPHAFIFFLLFLGGYTRSMVFTALQSLGYADVPQTHMSRATTIAGVVQQLGVSMGVAMSALAVNWTRAWHGHDVLMANDFWPGFLAIGGLCIAASGFFFCLKPNVGEDLMARNSARTPNPSPVK